MALYLNGKKIGNSVVTNTLSAISNNISCVRGASLPILLEINNADNIQASSVRIACEPLRIEKELTKNIDKFNEFYINISEQETKTFQAGFYRLTVIIVFNNGEVYDKYFLDLFVQEDPNLDAVDQDTIITPSRETQVITLSKDALMVSVTVLPIPDNYVEAPFEPKFSQLINGTLTELIEEDLAGATKVNDYAFYKQVNLKRVKLPKTIKTIGVNAFGSCTLIESIDCSGVEAKINYGCFNNLSNLKSLNLKDIVGAVEVRNDSAGFIIDCKKLTDLNLENYTGTINKLLHNSAVKILLLPKVNTISDRALSGNSYLETIYCRDLTRIEQRYTFSGCNKLTKFIIANKNTICSYAPSTSGNIPNNTIVYVPLHLTLTPEDDNVASYRIATNWSAIASRIFPLIDRVDELNSIDPTLYAKCCVDDRETNFPVYNYINNEWVKET